MDNVIDTNILIGVLKQHEPALKKTQGLSIQQCGYSVITRMELLGFPDITEQEKRVINQFLSVMQALPLDKAIEERVIALRQQRKIKLPDTIVLATAIEYEVPLVTLDRKLINLSQQFQGKTE